MVMGNPKAARPTSSRLTHTASLKPDYLGAFIDSLIKAKKNSNDGNDYSNAIARVMVAKACEDELSIYHSFALEIMILITKLSSKTEEGFEVVPVEELIEAIDELIVPFSEIVKEKISDLEDEMTWIEVAKFKTLCGE